MRVSEQDKLPKPFLVEDLGYLYPTLSSNYKKRFGIYKCGFCGNEWKASTSDIKSNKIKSCGCYNIKLIKLRSLKHGKTGTKLYNNWKGMKGRVLNVKNHKYIDYGGRGISICDEWKDDFMSFYTWAMANGYEENKGLSIDRIDNEGNYCPENCRWTTITIQNRNQRVSKKSITGFKGVTYDRRDKVCKVHIGVSKVSIYLGSFKTPIEGAIAYNNYIIENNLEGFILNEIKGEI